MTRVKAIAAVSACGKVQLCGKVGKESGELLRQAAIDIVSCIICVAFCWRCIETGRKKTIFDFLQQVDIVKE